MEELNLSTPKRIAKQIVGLLDPKSLFNLRGVCRETKTWVDGNPSAIRKCAIYLHGNRFLALTRSNVEWSNVKVKGVDLQLFLPGGLRAKVFPFVKDLEIRGRCKIWDVLATILLQGPPGLESLVISGVLIPSEPATLARKLGEMLKQDRSLIGLKKLQFEGVHPAPDLVYSLTRCLITRCPLLESIILPVASQGSLRYFDINDYISQSTFLLTYLESLKSKFAFFHSLTPKSIDFGYIQCRSDCDCRLQGIGVYEQIFGIHSSDFLQIVSLCVKLGFKLYNVAVSSLPLEIKKEDRLNLIRCIGSLTCSGELELDAALRFSKSLRKGSPIDLNLTLRIPRMPANSRYNTPINYGSFLKLGTIYLRPTQDDTWVDLVWETKFLGHKMRMSCTHLALDGAFCLGMGKLSEAFPKLEELIIQDLPLESWKNMEVILTALLEDLLFLRRLVFKNCKVLGSYDYIENSTVKQFVFKKCPNLEQLEYIGCRSSKLRSNPSL